MKSARLWMIAGSLLFIGCSEGGREITVEDAANTTEELQAQDAMAQQMQGHQQQMMQMAVPPPGQSTAP